MYAYKERLMRQSDKDNQQEVTCSLGYVPRYGSTARRKQDCKLDCRDYDACERKRQARHE